MWTADKWRDYELCDASDGERLEKWNGYVLRRPDPQVLWKNEKESPLWKKANAIYTREGGGGSWTKRNVPASWNVSYGDLTFKIKINGGAEVAADYVTVNGNTVQVYTDAIAATNFDDVYTVTVYNGETAGATFDYSVKSYVYAFQSAIGEDEDQVMLVKALYNYGLSAKAYADAQ